MRNRSLFLFLSLLALGLLSATVPFAAASPSGRDDAYIHNFEVNSESKRLYVEIRNFPDESDATIEAWKQKFAQWTESAWRSYEEEYGFRTPANFIDTDGVPALKIFYEKGSGGGNAGATGWIRTAGPPLNTPRVETEAQSTIAHELFHSVQFRYGTMNSRYRATFVEGTAQLAPSLINEDVYELVSTTESCESIYLEHPEGRMWFRPGGEQKANVCSSVLWWKYLTQQFSAGDPNRIDHGIDTLSRLLNHLEPENGWRQREIDQIVAVGDFNGNSLDEMLVTSDFYVGILSPMFFNPTTIGVVADEGCFGGSWKYKATDYIAATCDVMEAENDEFIIQSGTHFGIIGYEDDDFVTYDALFHGARFGEGGWLSQSTDKIVGTGDFDNDGKCELLIQSGVSLGLIERNSDGFATLTARAIGFRLGEGGWLLSATDELLGTGDFNGDRLTDFIIKSDTHVGLISYDPVSQSFQTLGVRALIALTATAPQFHSARLAPNNFDLLIAVGSNGVELFSPAGNGGLSVESFIANGELPGDLSTMQIRFADVDGDGYEELISKADDGTLTAGMLQPTSNTFLAEATAVAGTELNDGWNGREFRVRWTPNAAYRILATGDFNGDGGSDMIVQDNGFRLVITLGENGQFMTREKISDEDRYDSLVSKLDQFIRAESANERNLHSMFTDFSVANYVNALDGPLVTDPYRYSDELRYPDSIDYDNNPSTPPMSFALDRAIANSSSAEIDQEQWASQVFRFTAATGKLELNVEQQRETSNASYTTLLIENNHLVRRAIMSGASISETLDIEADQSLILIVTSFEAPLSYTISVESTPDSTSGPNQYRIFLPIIQ